MAIQLKYSAAEKKRLKDASWNGRGKGSAAVRAMKMSRPICNVCQKGLDTKIDWFDTCDHDPYWSLQPKVIKTPVYEIDEDGDTVLTDEKVVTKMIRIPNITEVIISVRSNDGEGVQKMQRKGFKFLPDIGLAPMCEMYGCGRAWPSIRTDFGDYCSENHAKLCAADALEVKFTVNDPRVYRTELQGVSV